MEKSRKVKRSAHLGEPEPGFWANPLSFTFFLWYNRVLLQVQDSQICSVHPACLAGCSKTLSPALCRVCPAFPRCLQQPPKSRCEEAKEMLGAALIIL